MLGLVLFVLVLPSFIDPEPDADTDTDVDGLPSIPLPDVDTANDEKDVEVDAPDVLFELDEATLSLSLRDLFIPFGFILRDPADLIRISEGPEPDIEIAEVGRGGMPVEVDGLLPELYSIEGSEGLELREGMEGREGLDFKEKKDEAREDTEDFLRKVGG